MFKLTQLLHKGKQVKELNEIQREKERIQEELNKYETFPKCSYETKIYSDRVTVDMVRELSDTLMLVFVGKAPFEAIGLYCGNNFNLKKEETHSYFNKLGNYFLNLSGNLELRKSLEERLVELKRNEYKLKEKLGIK